MTNVHVKKLFLLALVVAAVIAGIASIFYYLEKDSVYSALKMLPADADIVFAVDLTSLHDGEMVLKLVDKVEDQDWYEVPKDFDWRDVHTLSGAIWLDGNGRPEAFAWVLRGDFELDMAEDFIEIEKKKRWSVRETEFMDSKAWEIDNRVLIVWIDDGVVALGDEDALEKVIEAYDGESDRVGDSRSYQDLLDHVDSGASTIALGQGLPDNPNFPVNAFSFSLNGGAEMEMALYLEADDTDELEKTIDEALEGAKDGLGGFALYLEADDTDEPNKIMDGALEEPEDALRWIGREDIKDIVDSFSDFVESVKVEELDDGLLIEAEADLPDGFSSTAMPLAALIGVPVSIKYMRRAKTTEAMAEIDKMVKGASFYYTKPYIDASGQKQPCQFPKSQGQTPLEGTCCSTNGLGGPDRDGDDRCDSNPNNWTELTWSALTFQVNDQHYFVYSFDSSGVLSQAQFTASAFGDLDCDGDMSTFQRIGWGDPQANFAECAMYGSPAFFVDNETE